MANTGNLTPRQLRAIPAVLTSATIRDAAAAANVGERTLYRWMTEAGFLAELHQAQDRAIDDAISRLAGEARAAAETLASIHKDPETPAAVRVQAAQAVLSHVLRLREQRELADRVAALEARL